jgi:hypothetical protein
MFKIDTSALPQSTKREPLFEIDGTEYTIPVSLGGEIGLRATRIVEEKGELAGELFVIDQTIGREAYDALCAVENLPKSVLAGIMSVCREKVFGGMEQEGKG